MGTSSAHSDTENVKLPLQYAWTLWHTAPKTGGGWSANYKQIAQFSTVNEFWRLFNNISPPSLLDAGSSYHLFKGKVKPAWEDKFNANGGSWAFRFAPSKQKNQHQRGIIEIQKWRLQTLQIMRGIILF